MLDQYERKNEDYFRDLICLKQNSRVNSYVEEFQRLSVMVSRVLEERLTHMFMGGLVDPLRGMV